MGRGRNESLGIVRRDGLVDVRLEFVSQILWRTAKEDVVDEIELPPQESITHRMRLDPVSLFAYRRELDHSWDIIFNDLSNCDMDASFLDKPPRDLVTALNRLRQLCCTPSTSAASFAEEDQKTLSSVLTQLMSKAKHECTEALRSLLLARNGMAGLMILEGNFAGAVQSYRETLARCDQYADTATRLSFEIDRFQLLHAITNLHSICPTDGRGLWE